MSDLFWLADAQIERLKPFFPLSHGVARVDDRRVLSGTIFFNRNGLRWRGAPAAYGPHKSLYNRWFRWSLRGIFGRILLELVRQDAETEMIMSDATHLKTAPHPACGKKGVQQADRADAKGRTIRSGGSDRPAARRDELEAAPCI